MGCSDDDDPVVPKPAAPQVLGVMGLDFGFGGRTLADTLAISLKVGALTPEPAFLFKLQATDDLSGSVTTVNAATNPEFADAVSLLVNGVDNLLEFDFVFLPGGAGNGIDAPESFLFDGGISGEFLPDFAGAQITHVNIAIDVISIETPGRDPNNDGIWVDSSGSGRLVIMGHPNTEVH